MTAVGGWVLTAGLIFLSPFAWGAHFNYLYIEASEGNSSGGHAAIQFDDEIYHYQYVDPGLIRLFRQNKGDFHFLYRYLQNRPIHLSRIEVSEETFGLLKDQFKQQFLEHEARFKRLEALQQDRALLRRLLHRPAFAKALDREDADPPILRVKGAGLFYSAGEQQIERRNTGEERQQKLSIQSLREKVEQRYGAGYLQLRRQEIESQIESLIPLAGSDFNSGDTSEKFSAVYSFAEKYADCMTGLYALKVLAETPPLQADALLTMRQPSFKISARERQGLQQLRRHLELALIDGFASTRPDWGYAVLVNLARIVAIDVSLRSGYWVFVDDFADDGEKVSHGQYRDHQSDLRILIRDARSAVNKFRAAVFSAKGLNEAGYSLIEMAANRYGELLKSEQYQTFRFNGEKALPSRSIGFPESPVPNLAEAQLRGALSDLDQAESRLIETLNQRYRYNLLNRNCITELFLTIHRALMAPYGTAGNFTDLQTLTVQESEKRLGGYVGMPYNFIPFVSYHAVLNHYRVTETQDLASYRNLELTKLKARQNPLLTKLRESNIVTSRLYRYNPDDALFVFFTDDNIWLRSVFGLFNTTAGVAQSIAGLFSWPLDSGRNLKSGATGILMSLPEILFFNMRKGSYKFLSINRLPPSDLNDDEQYRPPDNQTLDVTIHSGAIVGNG